MAIELFDRRTQKALGNVSNEEAQRIIAESGGQIVPVPGQRINVKSQAGQSGSIDALEAIKALEGGFRFEGSEEARIREGRTKFGGRGLESLGLGAASGLTLGFSNELFSELGVVDKETIEGLREFSGGGFMTGEIGGAVLPALFSGGGTVAGRAGLEGAKQVTRRALAKQLLRKSVGVAGAPIRGTIGAGRLAARAVPQQFKTLKTITELGTEGALAAGAFTASEQLFQDEELSAQTILAGAGMGLGLGAGLGSLGGVFRAGKSGATSALNRVARDSVEDIGFIAALTNSAAVEPFVKISARITGKSEDAIRPFVSFGKKGAAARELAERGVLDDAPLQEFTKRTGDLIERGTKFVDDLERKIPDLDASLRNVEPVQAGMASFDVMEPIAKKLDNIPRNSPARRAANDAKRLLRKANDAITKPGKKGVTSNVYRSVSELSEKFDDMAARIGDDADGDLLRLKGELNESSISLKDHLRDRSVWGDASQIQSTKEVAQNFRRSMQSLDGLMTDGAVDKAKVAKFFTDKAAGEQAAELVQAGIDEFVDTYTKTLEGADSVARNTPGKGKAGDRLRAIQTDLEEQAKMLKLAGELGEDAGSGAFPLTGAALGGALGGAPGAAIGGAVQRAAGAVRNPAGVARTIAILDQANALVRGESTKLIDTFIAGGKATSKTVPTEKVMKSNVFLKAAGKKPRTAAEGFRETRRIINDMTPEGLAQRMEQNIGHMTADAPNIGVEMQGTVQRGLEFLKSKLPKNPFEESLNPNLVNWRPSDVEMARFARYIKAVSEPTSVLKDLAAGKIFREGAETLREVYPRYYGMIQEQLMGRVATLRKQLPYASRGQLSILFLVPVEESYRRSSVQLLQRAHLVNAQAQGDQQRQLNARAGITISKFSEQAQTPAERLSGR